MNGNGIQIAIKHYDLYVMAVFYFKRNILHNLMWICISIFSVLLLWLAVPDCEFYDEELQHVYPVIQWGHGTTSPQDTLCLLTQLTHSRVARLQKLAEHWRGPISAAIYVSKQNIDKLKKTLSGWMTGTGRKNILIALVVQNGTLYPVNHLRNVALNNTLAKYILTVDVDFLPNIRLYDNIINLLREGLLEQGKRALVVPAFELMDNSPFPATKKDAIEYYKKGKLVSFHSDTFPVGHRASLPDKWVQNDHVYEVSYEIQYEPYTVISRTKSPLYNEFFIHRFFNKAAYTFELYQKGWSFFVMPDGYLVHASHQYDTTKNIPVFRCARKQWFIFQQTLSLQQRVATEYLL